MDSLQDHFLRFGAVNQEAEVYLNGRKIKSHLGGYTAFNVDLTPFLTFSNDTILVEVDNSHNKNIPPLRGDFTFYGGIYRDVQLISLSKTHFDLAFYGSEGVFVDPKEVSKDNANLDIWGLAKNFDNQKHNIQVDLYSTSGDLIARQSTDLVVDRKWQLTLKVENPILWGIDSPHLYRVEATIKSKNTDAVIDEIHIPVGIRYFSFESDKGFFINGKPKKLIGVNRHQDRKGMGNALQDHHHLEDMQLIKDLGVNYLRTAHYPQDEFISNFCDRNGIVMSVEIPLDHEITQTEEFKIVCKNMTLEMIYQNYNHPSILIWAYMNEMGLGKQIKRDSIEMIAVRDLAIELEELIRSTDPNRYTMIPNHGYFEIYETFNLTDIPMIVGWNLYYGWYEPDLNGFGEFIDHAYSKNPSKPIIITEYGAGADPRITSYTPERFDFSIDWAMDFHKSHLIQISNRDFISGAAVWNMFDFGSEGRQDAVPYLSLIHI